MSSHGEAPCAARGLAPCARRRSRERRALRWLAPGLGRRMLTDTSRKTAWNAKDGNGQTCASPATAGSGGEHKLYPAKRAPVYTGAARTGSRRHPSADRLQRHRVPAATGAGERRGARVLPAEAGLESGAAGDGRRDAEAAIVSPPAGPSGRQGQQASSACPAPPRRRHRVGAMCGGKLPACGAGRRGPGMPPASAVQASAGQRRSPWVKAWQAGRGLGTSLPELTPAPHAQAAPPAPACAISAEDSAVPKPALACPVCPQPAPAQAARAMGQ